jgi:nicotinate-nucleotide adenylyltransferase
MNKTETHYDFHPGKQTASLEMQKLPRIGIYSASFDPVHTGNIIFALKAQKIAGLERIYFVPERKPQSSTNPEHYVHRSVMLKHALRPYRQFEIFDLPDAQLNGRSLSRIIKILPPAELSLLTTASEILWFTGDLPMLYKKLHLVVAVTSHDQMAEVLARLASGDELLGNITFIDIGEDHISSKTVRRGIRSGKPVRGILPSVWSYARKQWLYLPPIRHGQHLDKLK